MPVDKVVALAAFEVIRHTPQPMALSDIDRPFARSADHTHDPIHVLDNCEA